MPHVHQFPFPSNFFSLFPLALPTHANWQHATAWQDTQKKRKNKREKRLKDLGSGSRAVAEAEIGTPQVSQNYYYLKKKKTTILINMNLFNILLELFALDLEFLFKLLDQIIYTLIEKGSHAQSNACVDCSSPNLCCWYFLNSFNLQSYWKCS